MSDTFIWPSSESVAVRGNYFSSGAVKVSMPRVHSIRFRPGDYSVQPPFCREWLNAHGLFERHDSPVWSDFYRGVVNQITWVRLKGGGGQTTTEEVEMDIRVSRFLNRLCPGIEFCDCSSDGDRANGRWLVKAGLPGGVTRRIHGGFGASEDSMVVFSDDLTPDWPWCAVRKCWEADLEAGLCRIYPLDDNTAFVISRNEQWLEGVYDSFGDAVLAVQNAP